MNYQLLALDLDGTLIPIPEKRSHHRPEML